MDSIDIAALQLENIDKLESYWKICNNEHVQVLIIGEYTINDFFHDLINNLDDNIARTATYMKRYQELSQIYQTLLIIPIIRHEKGKYYKSMAWFENGKINFYNAQRLLRFEHWNEKGFFANTWPRHPTPPIIEISGLRIAILFGFEVYFDAIWINLKARNVDVVCVASASTFQSKERWRAILQSRAFFNGCYILRANKIGKYETLEEPHWVFYGDSLFISPSSTVESFLGDKEELLIAKVLPHIITDHKNYWKF